MQGTHVKATVEKNYRLICRRIGDACASAGRQPDDVTLIAVTKYARWEWVKALSQFHSTFGESRPQQLAERQPQLSAARWHLIGQLQRNKARLAVNHADVAHSVDSEKLCGQLSSLCREAAGFRPRLEVLLQVNLSEEASKSGFGLEEIRQLWPGLYGAHRGSLQFCGLMTMPPRSSSPESSRAVFRSLAELREELNEATEDAPLKELSMGMTGDFEVAIDEGATLIRVGTALFEGLSQ